MAGDGRRHKSLKFAIYGVLRVWGILTLVKCTARLWRILAGVYAGIAHNPQDHTPIMARRGKGDGVGL